MTNSTTAAINIERHNSDGSNDQDMSYVGSFSQFGTSYVDVQNERFSIDGTIFGSSIHEGAVVSYHSSITPNSNMTTCSTTTTTTPNLLSPLMKLLKINEDIELVPGEVKINVIDQKETCTIEGGTLMLTNYRLIYLKNSSPQTMSVFTLMELELTDFRDAQQVVISMKGGRVQKFQFMTAEEAIAWHKQLTKIVSRLNRGHSVVTNGGLPLASDETNGGLASDGSKIETNDRFDVFAWSFSEQIDKQPKWDWLKSEKAITEDVVRVDYKRLKLAPKFRVSEVNRDFEICGSYPEKVIVPEGITDEELKNGASYRGLNRFPVVVYKSPTSKAVLMRSAQPQVGIFGWTNPNDEKIIELVVKSVAEETGEQKQFIILDARTYTAAFANRARSGGFENTENYQRAKLEFLGLPNIHTVRNSFIAIRNLLQSYRETDALTSLQNTGWLHNLNNLLISSFSCANYVKNGHCVLVHCSDGWDRTTQIISLAKLCLDKYYRTIEGFEELIRREWLAFGHKFYDRQQSFNGNWDAGERSPIFLQFLEAVRHLQKSQPTAFEFTHAYLLKLAQHAYSGLFGTFLFNSHKEMKEAVASRQATLVEIWRFLGKHNEEFVNISYEKNFDPNMMDIPCSVLNLSIWYEVYTENNKNLEALMSCQSVPQQPQQSPVATVLPPSSNGGTVTPGAATPVMMMTSPMKDDQRPSSGLGTPNGGAGTNGGTTLIKSKSSESVSSINIDSTATAAVAAIVQQPQHSVDTVGGFGGIEMTSSMYQQHQQHQIQTTTTTSNQDDVRDLMDHDGLLKYIDRQQEEIRRKNMEKQKEIEKRDKKIKEMKNQRSFSERASRPSSSSIHLPGDRTTSLCEDIGYEGTIDRADSDMSVINEGEYSVLPTSTTWDNNSKICSVCTKKLATYSMYREEMKHNCGMCGKVVCDSCSRNRYHSVEKGDGEQKRACDTCYKRIQNNGVPRSGSLSNISYDVTSSFCSSPSPFGRSASPSSLSLNILPSSSNSSSASSSSQAQQIPSSCKSSTQSMSSPRPSPGEPFSRHGSSQAVKG